MKKKMLVWNSIMWLAAMALPGGLSLALAEAKFPWPVIIPCLLLGPMLLSNSLIAQAIGDPEGEAATEKAP
jgi:hypothetical protein